MQVSIDDHSARIMANERHILKPQLGNEPMNISRQRAFVIRGWWNLRGTDARKIDGNDMRFLAERAHNLLEGRPAFRPAMQKEDGRLLSRAALDNMDGSAFYIHLP